MSSHIQRPEQGEKISMQGDKLTVPNHPIIPFVEGDGTGADIWKASVRVLDAAVEKAYGSERKIEWMEVYAGEKSVQVYGEGQWLPQETIDAFNEYLVRDQGAADHARRRRHPQHQRGAASGTGPLRLRASGAVLRRRAQPPRFTPKTST